jgi:hypothetical protein
MQWKKYGFSAEDALTNLRLGITDPSKVSQRG